ncbi:uncharacterized protein LOC134179145 [Corticium candelabrum]|uniref:uncharacterized protein LOC134179145 n=1 Tax=Corticium candelabrum TaxID=121492 RepID=UPI002E264632|nr:uncharacterized protein LOC134179145 [Corticium candelabrum]
MAPSTDHRPTWSCLIYMQRSEQQNLAAPPGSFEVTLSQSNRQRRHNTHQSRRTISSLVRDRLEEPVSNSTLLDGKVSATSNFGETEPNVGDLASMGRPSTGNILIQPEAEAQEEAGTSTSATQTLKNDTRQLQRQPTEASGVRRLGRERKAPKRLDL